MKKYRVLRMAALLGVLILPGCSQGILEDRHKDELHRLRKMTLKWPKRLENGTGQDLEGQIDTGRLVKGRVPPSSFRS